MCRCVACTGSRKAGAAAGARYRHPQQQEQSVSASGVLRWQQRLTPTPGACVGGALLPESMWRRKLLWQSPPLLVPTPVIAQAPSHTPCCGDHTLAPQTTPCPHTANSSPLLGLPSEARASAPSPCSPQCKRLRLESGLPGVRKAFHVYGDLPGAQGLS